MALRPEEQRCAERFQKWLSDLGRASDWKPGPANRCPDLCFRVKSELWAVEVTGLFQYIDWDGKTRNIKYSQATLQAMCKRLLQYVQPGAKLDYHLFVSAPFNGNWQDVESRATEFIRSGRTEEESLVLQHGKVLIRAVPGSGNVNWMPMLDGTANVPGKKKMIADIMASVDYSVEQILEKKLPRLRTVNGYDRKLILIWSNYYFANVDRVGEVLSKQPLTSADVDSIVLIDSVSGIGCVADPSGLFC